MAIASWPPALPQNPDRNGFEERPQSRILVFPVEAGRGKRRRRSVVAADFVTAAFTLTLDQLPVFHSFFDITLDGGVLPFSWADPRDGVIWRWWFDAEDPYRITPIAGPLWLLSCHLERTP